MKRKKLLSLFLAVTMIMSAPNMAFADENVVDTFSEEAQDAEFVIEEIAEEEAISDSEDTSKEAAEEESVLEEEESVEENLTDADLATSENEEKTEMSGPSVMTSEMREYKKKLSEHSVLSDIKSMKEGVDYEEDTVILWTDSKDVVDYTAKVYDADVVSYENNVAIFKLRSLSVEEAVALACDTTNDYPAINANTYIKIDLPDETISEGSDIELTGARAMLNDWSSYVLSLSNPDPALESPTASYYQWHHDMVNSYAAWGVTLGNPACKVAVIDSGFDKANEDISDITVNDMGLAGGNYPEKNNKTQGARSHGTHVAGIIGAKQNNGVFGSGIAPNATLLGYRVMDNKGTIPEAELIKSIKKAADDGAWIINMSLGGPTYTSDEDAACEYAKSKGVAIFAAMGNEASNNKSYPAAFDSVFGVSACDKSGHLSSFSTYGSWREITAPGVGIWSTYIAEDSDGIGFHNSSGTSQATPVTAGIAALYLSALYEKSGKNDGKSPISPDELIKAMKKATTDGIIDAGKLLQASIEAPKLSLYDKANKEITGTVLSTTDSGYVKLSSADETTKMMVYTIDGTVPSASNGYASNGKIVDVDPDPIYLGFADIDSTVTINAIAVNGMGVCSSVSTIKVKVVEEDDAIAEPGAGVNKVKTIDFDVKSITLKAYDDDPKDTYQITPVFKDAGKTEIPVAKVKYKFTTNKKSVATVSSTGLVTGIKPGNAVITCKALDGSNVKKTIKVKVVAGANGVYISGQKSVAPGKSAKYTANACGYAKVKVVSTKWSLLTPVNGVTIDENKGTVNVASSATNGASFTIKVVISDGLKERTATKTVKVAPMASAISIGLADNYDKIETYYGSGYGSFKPTNAVVKKDVLKQVTLYSKAIPDSEGIARNTNQLQLKAVVTGNDTPLSWGTNNSSVAGVKDGMITAYKAGKATITAYAQDGSKKKASITVNVINPASYIKILSHTNFTESSFDCEFIKVGGSRKFTTEFGDTFGKVSNKKVEWEYIIGTKSGGKYVNDVATKKALEDGHLIKVSNGTITLKPGAASYITKGNNLIQIYAKTTDGTGLSDMFVLYPVNNACEKLYFYTKTGLKSTATYSIESNDYIRIPVYGGNKKPLDNDYGYFNVVSSNPDIASAYFDSSGVLFLCGGLKAGKATITVKAADGGKGVAKLIVTNK